MPFPPLNSSALPGALAALLLLGMACSLALQGREPGAAAWELRSDGFQLPIAQRLEQR